MGVEKFRSVLKGDGLCNPKEELPRVAPFHKSVEQFGECDDKSLLV